MHEAKTATVLALLRFHYTPVIEPSEVQHAVDNKKGEILGCGHAPLFGMTCNLRLAHNDLARILGKWEREYVGSFVDLPVRAV